MIKSSDDLYTSGEYFKNKPTSDAEDSVLKAEWIHNLNRNNHLGPADFGKGGISVNLRV